MDASETPPHRIALDVPEGCRRELIRIQDRRQLFSGAVLAAMLSVGAFCHQPGTVVVGLTYSVFFLSALPSWRASRMKSWRHEIGPNQVNVLWFQGFGLRWDWCDLPWSRSAVLGVEETEWRGWPALRLIRQTKNLKWRPDWLIVYAPDDAERVRAQVIPAIEAYRRQYRQQVWADRLRS